MKKYGYLDFIYDFLNPGPGYKNIFQKHGMRPFLYPTSILLIISQESEVLSIIRYRGLLLIELPTAPLYLIIDRTSDSCDKTSSSSASCV
jgi:hypothetical protein